MSKYGLEFSGTAATFKIKPPDDVSRHSAYFTIVGGNEPGSFFFNSKDMRSFQWITLSMTLMSRLIEKGATVDELIEILEETFQPGGDYVIPGSNVRVNSVVHHLAICLKEHLKK